MLVREWHWDNVMRDELDLYAFKHDPHGATLYVSVLETASIYRIMNLIGFRATWSNLQFNRTSSGCVDFHGQPFVEVFKSRQCRALAGNSGYLPTWLLTSIALSRNLWQTGHCIWPAWGNETSSFCLLIRWMSLLGSAGGKSDVERLCCGNMVF